MWKRKSKFQIKDRVRSDFLGDGTVEELLIDSMGNFIGLISVKWDHHLPIEYSFRNPAVVLESRIALVDDGKVEET